MRWFPIPAAVVAAALAAGCTTKEDYEAGRQIVGESPAARRLVMDKCLRDSASLNTGQKRELAVVMRTSEDRVPALLCQRIIAAMLSGRLSYEEVQKFSRIRQPKLVSILRGG